MILFLAAGWAYGSAAGTINRGDDLVAMMTESMKDMGYYLVLAFAAAHFVAMFNWSNLFEMCFSLLKLKGYCATLALHLLLY